VGTALGFGLCIRHKLSRFICMYRRLPGVRRLETLGLTLLNHFQIAIETDNNC